MATIRVTQATGCIVVYPEEQRGKRTVGDVLAKKLVHGAQEPLGLIQRDRALASHIGLQIGHQEGCRDPLARDVADNEANPPPTKVEKIVVIASNLPGLVADTRIFQ